MSGGRWLRTNQWRMGAITSGVEIWQTVENQSSLLIEVVFVLRHDFGTMAMHSWWFQTSLKRSCHVPMAFNGELDVDTTGWIIQTTKRTVYHSNRWRWQPGPLLVWTHGCSICEDESAHISCSGTLAHHVNGFISSPWSLKSWLSKTHLVVYSTERSKSQWYIPNLLTQYTISRHHKTGMNFSCMVFTDKSKSIFHHLTKCISKSLKESSYKHLVARAKADKCATIQSLSIFSLTPSLSIQNWSCFRGVSICFVRPFA